MVELSQDVISAIARLYQNDHVKLADLLTKILSPGNPTSSMITVLNSLVSNEPAFNRAAENMLQDLYKAERHPENRKFLKDVYENYLNANRVLFEDGSIDLKTLVKYHPNLPGTVAYSLIRALSQLPPEQKCAVIRSMANNSVQLFGGSTSAVRGFRDSNLGRAGQIATIALVAIPLTWEAFNNIRRWWRGEISGKRCAAKIIDSVVTTGAGVGGGVAGAAIGMSYGGPVGAVVGAVVGSVSASQLTHLLMDWFTRELFDLPKSEALENAYRFLGLHHKTSNSEVNSRYRELALKYHPDKDGSDKAAENWHKLQVSMAVIKISQE